MITYVRVRFPRWRTEAENGPGCLGGAVLSAAVAAASAALSGSPLARACLSSQVGCQGRRLQTLARCLPDPGAAHRQEDRDRDRDRGGQAAARWVRLGSSLGWSEDHLQTLGAGRASAPKLRLSGPD